MAVWTRIRTRTHRDTAATESPATASKAPSYARMAGSSGIIFGLLFTVALVLMSRAPGLAAPDSAYTAFYASGDHRALVIAGLYIVPFAGIAFLWHVMATRTLLHELPGPASAEMPRALQLAAGVAFIVMVFAGMGLAGAIALLTQFSAAPLPSADVARAFSGAGYGMVFVYGARVAGMYMITTTTLLKSAGVLPRWAVWLGYLAAAVVLLSWTFHPAFALVLPGWVLVASVVLLVGAGRPQAQATPLIDGGPGTPVPAPR